MARQPDVTVMGGGIFGLSCAWEMARRGARVRLFEARKIAAGASGGVVGALAPHVPEAWTETKAFQLESLLAADGFWSEIARVSGTDTGYARLGRLQPIADAAALDRARAREKTAAELWQGRADWRIVSTDLHAGWAPVSTTGVLIEDTLSARINPAAACHALAAALRSRGSEVTFELPASAGGPVVWATGVWGLDALSSALGRDVGRAIKGQAALLKLDMRTQPQIFADGLHVVPHADGSVAVGSTTERDFDEAEATDTQLDALLGRARALVPALRDAPVLRRWAGLRARARSRAPMLGAWPDRPGHYVANGGFKIGFGLAPSVARAMADLVLDGRDQIPDVFRIGASL